MRTFLALCLLVATPAFAQSPDNSRIPPLTSLTDSTGAVFTLRAGIVYRNNVYAWSTATSLLAWQGNIYAFKFDKQWWQYVSGRWAAVGVDPSGGAPPPRIMTFTWNMPQPPADVALGRFVLYVDGVAQPLPLPAPVCTSTATVTTCTHPVPATLAPGARVSLTFTLESGMSNTVEVPFP